MSATTIHTTHTSHSLIHGICKIVHTYIIGLGRASITNLWIFSSKTNKGYHVIVVKLDKKGQIYNSIWVTTELKLKPLGRKSWFYNQPLGDGSYYSFLVHPVIMHLIMIRIWLVLFCLRMWKVRLVVVGLRVCHKESPLLNTLPGFITLYFPTYFCPFSQIFCCLKKHQDPVKVASGLFIVFRSQSLFYVCMTISVFDA